MSAIISDHPEVINASIQKTIGKSDKQDRMPNKDRPSRLFYYKTSQHVYHSYKGV